MLSVFSKSGVAARKTYQFRRRALGFPDQRTLTGALHKITIDAHTFVLAAKPARHGNVSAGC
jgi:hypothetical protein